jgi:rhodanese-related sulfurtransferase
MESEYAAEHVDESYMNLWLTSTIGLKILIQRTFLLHCQGGYRSMMAASILLKARGFRNTEIEGGFNAYNNDNLKTDFVCQSKVL